MPATPTSPVPSRSMLAGSGTSMFESRSAAAGRTATGVAEAATGCVWTEAGLMPYGSPAKAVALATTLTPATIKTEAKQTNNGRGFIWFDQPHRVPPGSRPNHSKVYTISKSRRFETGTGRISYDCGAFRTQDNSAGQVMQEKEAVKPEDCGSFVSVLAAFMDFQNRETGRVRRRNPSRKRRTDTTTARSS